MNFSFFFYYHVTVNIFRNVVFLGEQIDIPLPIDDLEDHYILSEVSLAKKRLLHFRPSNMATFHLNEIINSE